ncbi:hypothetical protein, conserved [Trypanosoma cruzi]|uniref:MEX67-like NTF2-like domain-containing protein n=1 Tax=Trypanosoma cruzi (strain CL Brener) TaxID=353153 RepID=Q4DP94_TRYCC|nr:hypothetical protein, conserved [Trypanosoma cruzi]EAN94338.1 hypothetical protein, conserved [Trypanosoma cruzi]|eukprot:XP_816189.1 hypothetical protein [Trypanosoma cruzi strain CL Brener]
MSRPYNKHRGRDGGRGNPGRGNTGRGAFPQEIASNERFSRWNERGNSGPGDRNNNKSNNSNKKSGDRDVAAVPVMTTLLDLLFQKSAGAIFDPNTGMLNLSRFKDSPDLLSVQRSVDFNSVTFCKSLADVIKNKIGTSLRILVLNENNIRKLTVLLTALEGADIHRGVTAISATGNQISDFAFLGPLKKYEGLGELLLKENTITTRADYRTQMVRSLPKLMMLDGELIHRGLMHLPNPVPVSLNESQLGVLRFLESNLFAAAASRNYDALVNLYTSGTVFSVSRAEEPIPRRLPFDTAHNGDLLSESQRNVMTNDFLILRRQVRWRNLQNNLQSLSHVALGRAKSSLALQEVGGGERKFISVSHELNGNANVVFLSQNMKVPTCIVTIHGRLFWHWSPKGSNGADLIPREKAPFLTCFFDRTVSLLLDSVSNVWIIQNEMIFMRPDHTLVHENGSASSPLFFANEATRVESMRRRYLPNASLEVMQSVVEHFGSDADVHAFITGHLPTLPADRVEGALKDRSVMLSLLQR